MKPYLQLHIPQPCHENWETMHPTKQGKFCDSCAKQVIDFTLMTDAEVLNYFKNAHGKTCGRFSPDQLERTLQPAKNQTKKTWKWLVASGLMLLVNFKKSIAQQINTIKNNTVDISLKRSEDILLGDVQVVENVKVVVPKKKVSVEIVKDSSINGKVVDEKNNPIPYASIVIKNTNKGTITDANGEFKLNIKGNENKVNIIVSALGFEQEERTIVLKEMQKDTSIILKTKVQELTGITVVSYPGVMGKVRMGGVALCSKPDNKDTSLAAVRKALDNSLFTIVDNPLKVYPNPASKNATLNIEIGLSGNVQIQLLDLNGTLIMHDEVHNISKKQIVPLILPANVTAGIYFVKIIDPEKQKQYVEKVIVR